MLYLAKFLAMFPVNFTLSEALQRLKIIVNKLATSRLYLLSTLLLTFLSAYLIHAYSLRHPFLDSDNRHYSQKFYKYFISNDRNKFLLLPIYVLSALLVYEGVKATH